MTIFHNCFKKFWHYEFNIFFADFLSNNYRSRDFTLDFHIRIYYEIIMDLLPCPWIHYQFTIFFSNQQWIYYKLVNMLWIYYGSYTFKQILIFREFAMNWLVVSRFTINIIFSRIHFEFTFRELTKNSFFFALFFREFTIYIANILWFHYFFANWLRIYNVCANLLWIQYFFFKN